MSGPGQQQVNFGEEQLDPGLAAEFQELLESITKTSVKKVLARNKVKLVKREVVSEEALQGLTLEELLEFGLSKAAAAALKVAFPIPTAAGVGGAAGGSGVGQLLATPIRDRFVALLAKAHINKPDKHVLDVIERCCPHHMMVCSRPTTAVHLYQDAKLLPGSSTKVHFFEQHQLRINGPLFSDPLQGPASLLAATHNRRACVVKMLRDQLPPGARDQPGGREAAAVQALMTEMPEDMPLVPCKLVTLQLGSEHVSTGRGPGIYGALVMPRYIGSVVRTSPGPGTDDILLGGRRMVKALEYIHNKGYVHMDVKADNIMVDNEGDWWLGDFGGTVQSGQPVQETTEWCAPLHIMGTSAVPQYDWHMLAVALITLLSIATWEEQLVEPQPTRHVPPCKLRAAVQAVTHTSLAELLKDLLTRADI